MEILALPNDVLVEDMFFGEVRTSSGIILTDDNGIDRGIHPRWAKVYAVGEKNKKDINVGEWVLITHGRWSRAMEVDGVDTKIRKVDPNDILMKTSVNPNPEKWYLKGKE